MPPKKDNKKESGKKDAGKGGAKGGKPQKADEGNVNFLKTLLKDVLF